MRILYVIGDLSLGGAERHLSLVLPRLRARGIEPIVYGLTGKGELAPLLEADGIRVCTAFGVNLLRLMPRILRRLFGLLLTFSTLLFLIVRARPAIVHAFLPEAYVLASLAAMLARFPKRVMSRRSRNHYQARRWLLTHFEKWLHQRTDLVLGNSQAVCADLAGEGVPLAKLRLIYNGIEHAIGSGEGARARLRDELRIAADTVVLVMTANLIAYKGHVDLLDALAMIDQRLAAPWVLVCIGEDRGMGPSLDARANELGISSKIIWMGKRLDVPELLEASDIGVLSSHEEGFSNAVLEGMAAGLPMVVTDVGGNAEAVVNGESGFVIPPCNASALGDALEQLIVDRPLRLRMGKLARQRLSAKFSLDTCIERYLLLYQAISVGDDLPTVDRDGCSLG